MHVTAPIFNFINKDILNFVNVIGFTVNQLRTNKLPSI